MSMSSLQKYIVNTCYYSCLKNRRMNWRTIVKKGNNSTSIDYYKLVQFVVIYFIIKITTLIAMTNFRIQSSPNLIMIIWGNLETRLQCVTSMKKTMMEVIILYSKTIYLIRFTHRRKWRIFTWLKVFISSLRHGLIFTHTGLFNHNKGVKMTGWSKLTVILSRAVFIQSLWLVVKEK